MLTLESTPDTNSFNTHNIENVQAPRQAHRQAYRQAPIANINNEQMYIIDLFNNDHIINNDFVFGDYRMWL